MQAYASIVSYLFFGLIVVIVGCAVKPRIFARDTARQIEAFVELQRLKVVTCTHGGLGDYLQFGMHSQNFIYVLTVRNEAGHTRACWVVLTNLWFERRYRFRLVWKGANLLDG